MLVLLSASTLSAAHRARPARPHRRAPAVADFRDLAAAPVSRARTVIGGERTKEYILETTGGGVAILDYDNDGWPDIFLRQRRAPGDAARPTPHR